MNAILIMPRKFLAVFSNREKMQRLSLSHPLIPPQFSTYRLEKHPECSRCSPT